ncbi:hypothetical protein ACHAO1_003343 [Botrytis cinerea]
MSGQESNPLKAQAEGNGEKLSPTIPYYPNALPQNVLSGYSTQNTRSAAVPPPRSGLTPTIVHTPDRNSGYIGRYPYNRETETSLQYGYDHPPILSRFQQYKGNYTSPLKRNQGTNTPQHNVFVGVHSPMNPLATMPQASNNNLGRALNPAAQGYTSYSNPTPQAYNAPQRYMPFNNGFQTPVAGTVRQQAAPQYNSPLREATQVALNHSGGAFMQLHSPYLSAPLVDNMSGQNFKQSQVLRTPQWKANSSPLPRSTPAGISNSSGSPTPGNDDVGIKRKPAMVPKKYPLRPEHLMPGCIVWLSNYQDGHEPIICVQNHECNDKVKEKDGRNHPVMILRINQRRGSDVIGDVILDVALMTTLSGLTLENYVQKLRTIGPDPSKQWYLQETMPMSWAPQETPQLKGSKLEALRKPERDQESQYHAELNQRGNTLLFLSRGSMQRRSYMRVHHIYAVPIKQLQACSRYAKLAHMVRLDECGYRRVMEVLSLVPEPWESSVDRSVASAPQRLRNLRDEEMAQFHAIKLAESQSRQDEAVVQQGLNVAQQSPLGNASDAEAESRESC